MENKRSTYSERSDTFEDQIADATVEPISSESTPQHIQSIGHFPRQLPKKSNVNIMAVIAMVVVLSLVLIAFFIPWYSISMEMSMLGNKLSMNVDFYLDKIDGDSNFPDMENQTVPLSYADLSKQGETTETQRTFIRIFDNTKYITIGAIVTAIIALICMLGVLFHFGNSNTMRKLWAVFGIITFILALVACIYLMTELTGEMTDINDKKIDSFWYSDSKTFWGVSMSISMGPGYAWYLMIAAGIIALISSIFILKKPTIKASLHYGTIKKAGMTKKTKITLVILIIVICVLVAASLYLMFKEDDESQDDISRFIGTWDVNVDGSFGYHAGYDYTKETWTFYENRSLTIVTVYEHSNGSSKGYFNVKSGKLYYGFNAFNYYFSEGNTRLILTNTDKQETVILNKIS